MSPKKLNLFDNDKSQNTTNNALLSDNLNNIFDKLNHMNKIESQTNLKKIIKQKTFKEDSQDEIKDIYRKLLKRNKIDESDSEDSSNEIKKGHWYILEPDNRYKKIFDFTLAL
jgi:hypothetical protein